MILRALKLNKLTEKQLKTWALREILQSFATAKKSAALGQLIEDSISRLILGFSKVMLDIFQFPNKLSKLWLRFVINKKGFLCRKKQTSSEGFYAEFSMAHLCQLAVNARISFKAYFAWKLKRTKEEKIWFCSWRALNTKDRKWCMRRRGWQFVYMEKWCECKRESNGAKKKNAKLITIIFFSCRHRKIISFLQLRPLSKWIHNVY